MSVALSLPRIHQLTTEVANQIAAGEVIERPASVVKELVENSIDAAATRILIDIQHAGIECIRVQDNGQGIHKDDLKLALMPHATSKLTSFSDLSQIASLGFRGEALPSIASVSAFRLTSRYTGADAAWTVDNSMELKPAAHEDGTTVEVNDLFHATPARRKFLKSERTELLHIQSLIKAIALGHTNVAFKLTHNHEAIFNYTACADAQERRVSNICGKSFVNNSLYVESQRDEMSLWGWCGMSEQSRSQSDRQYFFINGRIVHDKNVNHAIRLAYADHIDDGRFPSYVLFLQIDPSRVDINVHPAKSEVRFAEPRNVHDFIYGALMSVFDNQHRVYPLGDNSDHGKQEKNTVNDSTEVYRQRDAVQTDFLHQRTGHYHYLSLAGGNYILVELGQEQLLIDLKKTRVLLCLHRLLAEYLRGGVKQRPVFVPLSVKLNSSQLATLEQYQEEITKWGFETELVSPARIAVRCIPDCLLYADTVRLITNLVDNISQQSHEAMAATLASHVNDSGVSMNNEEVEILVEDIRHFETEAQKQTSLPWRSVDDEMLALLMSS